MEEVAVKILIAPGAQPIEQEQVVKLVGDMLAEVRTEGDWRPGKCCENTFRHNDKVLLLALDYRPDGSHQAFVGLPHEIKSHPTQTTFMLGDGVHRRVWFSEN